MSDNTEQNEPCTAKLIAYVIAYVLAFVVPAALLVYLFPAHALWIVLVAGFLLFGVVAFHVGWIWDDPAWTPETRWHARNLPFVMVLFAVPTLVRSFSLRSLGGVCLYMVCIAAATLLPFALGRWAKRRRNGANAG